MQLDFTSSLYLGFLHGSDELKPWRQFSSGRPAALQTSETTDRVGEAFARLQGCEAGVVGPSTFHLFWDLFHVLARTEKKIAIFFDGGLYPIARWGIERVAARGIVVQKFPDHDAAELGDRLEQTLASGARPVVVTDGMRPGRWGPAPLRVYLRLVRKYSGYLIVDDTQALGILGRKPNTEFLYGVGGGGSLQWHNICGPELVTVSSLAKGLGVPIAILAGSREIVERFSRYSDTRVHCSPPSNASIQAAAHALESNLTDGEQCRRRLVQRVLFLRRHLAASGFPSTGGPFPVQTLISDPRQAATTLHRRLWARGVRTVLHRSDGNSGPRISWLITARHRMDDILRAVQTLAAAHEQRSARMLGG
jgi:8-amino-7-oxononanoate synthase